jgi:hypothetical protein
MNTSKSRLGFLCALAAWASCGSVGSCGGGEVIRNPRLDHWCGDMLCDWELDTGQVRRVGSWHAKDYAAELVGTGVRISQLSDTQAACIRFDLIADVEASAQVTLEIDFLDDGRSNWEQVIPESDWKRLSFLVTMPDWYANARFILRKQGEGRAVIAQLRARQSDACTANPVALDDRPGGAPCLSRRGARLRD